MTTKRLLRLVVLLALFAACESSTKSGGALPAPTTAVATTAAVATTIPDPAALETCSRVQEIGDYNNVLTHLHMLVIDHPDPTVGANADRVSGLVKDAAAALETSAVRVRDNQLSQAAAYLAQLVLAGSAPAGFGPQLSQALTVVETKCSEAGHPLHGVSEFNIPFAP